MTHTITICHTGSEEKTQFACAPTQTILEAAFAAGLVVPYGCKNGVCGSCKTPLNTGTISHSHDNTTVKAAIEEGCALLCCATPLSDVVLTGRVAQADVAYPTKKLPARVASIEAVAPDVIVLKLQLPAAEKLAFRAGQYLELILRDGSRRAYSMANAPHTVLNPPAQLELHVRHLPGGLFTDALFGVEGSKLAAVKEKDIVRIEVPQGTFYLREDSANNSAKPLIFLASGTGFAPIKAIIEHMIANNLLGDRAISLYWGGRQLPDLYQHALASSWAAQHPHIQYIPVLSNNTDSAWTGRTGFVHQAVMADFPDMSGHEVYACGAPIVIASAQRDFVAQCQLPADAFYADSFTSAADA